MEYKITITTTGGTGVSAGQGDTEDLVWGDIESIVLTFTGQPATTDVTISEVGGRTLITRANSGTSGTLYPMVQAHDGAGAAITGVYKSIYVDRRKLRVAVAQGDDNAAALVATIVVRPLSP